MKKDATVFKILDRIRESTNFELVEIVDYWEADLCAIGLKRSNKMVYISTFNRSDESAYGYDFDLEIVDSSLKDKLNVVESGLNVSESVLIDKVRSFLGIDK